MASLSQKLYGRNKYFVCQDVFYLILFSGTFEKPKNHPKWQNFDCLYYWKQSPYFILDVNFPNKIIKNRSLCTYNVLLCNCHSLQADCMFCLQQMMIKHDGEMVASDFISSVFSDSLQLIRLDFNRLYMTISSFFWLKSSQKFLNWKFFSTAQNGPLH